MTHPDLGKLRIVNDEEPEVALVGGGGREGVPPEFAPDDPLNGLAGVGTPRGKREWGGGRSLIKQLKIKYNNVITKTK